VFAALPNTDTDQNKKQQTNNDREQDSQQQSAADRFASLWWSRAYSG